MSTEIIIILTNTLLILAYFKLVPYYLRKRATSGTVAVPDDELDERLSPVLARVIYQGKVDNKSFVISVFDLAQRGAIKIKREDNGIIILTKADFINDNFIEAEEKVVLESLFSGRSEFVLDKLHENSLGRAFVEFKKVVSQRVDELTGTSKIMRYLSLLPPMALLPASFYYYLLFHERGWVDVFILLFFLLTFAMPIVFYSWFLFGGLYRMVKKYRKTSTGYVLLTLVAFLFVWILIFTGLIFESYVYLVMPIFVQVILLGEHKSGLNFSKSNADMINQIEGFRMYLNSVEKYRAVILNNTIPSSHEDYERNFSYVLALFDNVKIDWVEEVSELIGRTNFQEVSSMDILEYD